MHTRDSDGDGELPWTIVMLVVVAMHGNQPNVMVFDHADNELLYPICHYYDVAMVNE
jgi:hypothetical protein